MGDPDKAMPAAVLVWCSVGLSVFLILASAEPGRGRELFELRLFGAPCDRAVQTDGDGGLDLRGSTQASSDALIAAPAEDATRRSSKDPKPVPRYQFPTNA